MFSTFKAVALLGPRQCGKTTLARQCCDRHPEIDWDLNYSDLEDPAAINRLRDPQTCVARFAGTRGY